MRVASRSTRPTIPKSRPSFLNTNVNTALIILMRGFPADADGHHKVGLFAVLVGVPGEREDRRVVVAESVVLSK